MNLSSMHSFCIGAADAVLFFDNIRLERQRPCTPSIVAEPDREDLGDDADWRRIDPDAEKILLLSDFESPDEIHNIGGHDVKPYTSLAKRQHPLWLAFAKRGNYAAKIELSDEHVFHGQRSLKRRDR